MILTLKKENNLDIAESVKKQNILIDDYFPVFWTNSKDDSLFFHSFYKEDVIVGFIAYRRVHDNSFILDSIEVSPKFKGLKLAEKMIRESLTNFNEDSYIFLEYLEEGYQKLYKLMTRISNETNMNIFHEIITGNQSDPKKDYHPAKYSDCIFNENLITTLNNGKTIIGSVYIEIVNYKVTIYFNNDFTKAYKYHNIQSIKKE